MARVFDSRTGARVLIVSDDHYPPHVHARHQGEGWVIRAWFSFVSGIVGVLEIAPTDQMVRQRQLNQLFDEIGSPFDDCRRIWWEGKKTT